MILCMALLVKFVCSETKYKMSKILLVFLILTLIRPYYSVLFIPLIFMLAEKKQWAYFSSIFFFCILVIICLFSGTSLMQIVGVFLSPNFFNQAQYLTQSTAEVVLNTGYIPIINYIGSVWNLFMLLFAVFALLYQRKNPLIFISIAMILEMCMIYAFQYNGVTELRHKMFFVIPYVILFNEGCAFLRKGRSKILYIVGIIWFFILYTLLTLLLAN